MYKPSELLNHQGGIQEFLYPEKKEEGDFEGYVTRNNGDLETIFGLVTDYDPTVEKNGSVKCSVTITSTNSTLLDLTNDEKFKNKMIQALRKDFTFTLKVAQATKG